MDLTAYITDFLEENTAMKVRMDAHFFRLFLDACDDGQEHVSSLRLHGHRINTTLFRLTSLEALGHKNGKKRLLSGTRFAALHPDCADRVQDKDVSGRKTRVSNLKRAERKAHKYGNRRFIANLPEVL